MGTIETARQAILDAEVTLRDLIASALAEQRYADVKELADLADGLAQLIRSNNIRLSSSPPDRSSGAAPMTVSVKDSSPPAKLQRQARRVARPRGPAKKKGYPKFVRDEDRLVKIGWSKKNRKEYEHRVAREAVVAFVRHLYNSVEEDKVFDIDSLLPVKDATGEEVPGYQVYVVVAWLRDEHVIEKKGRDGYLIRDKSVLSGELNELWNSIQARRA